MYPTTTESTTLAAERYTYIQPSRIRTFPQKSDATRRCLGTQTWSQLALLEEFLTTCRADVVYEESADAITD
jgi:hypothetical protein